jgi:CubicO group peptidase (beta-lactamase class C family)
MKFYLICLPVFCLIQWSYAQTSKVDSLVREELRLMRIPGLAAAKIEKGTISWTRYYGLQDIERNIAVSDTTVFHLASISKTVTAAAIMQLHTRGYFKLDDEVNPFLPFRVVNPLYPNVPITFRQLLRHRSSLADNLEYLLPFWKNQYDGEDIPLDVFLSGYLGTDGKNYDAGKNFIAQEPGSEFEYSNMGFALLGYLVERIARMPFDLYCTTHLFDPLGMKHTHWFPKDLPERSLAIPYVYSDSLEILVRQPQSEFPDYPAGQLRSTLKDLAAFLACWSNDGNFAGKQILQAKAVQTLTPNDISLGFHTWFIYLLNTETVMYSHAGHDPGASTYVLYDPFSKKGLVVLTNGELTDYFKWRKLIDLLYNS